MQAERTHGRRIPKAPGPDAPERAQQLEPTDGHAVAEQFAALQAVVGNRAIAGIVKRAHRSLSREAVVALGQDDAFNPSSITDDLIRAIDQKDINPSQIPASELEEEQEKEKAKPAAERLLEGVTSFEVSSLPRLASGKRWARNVDAEKVIAVLDHLRPSQIAEVRKLYAQFEKRSLDEDLFGKGESGYPSSLGDDQRERIKVLLLGTRSEPTPRGAPGPEGGAASQVDNRFEADAIEIHQLVEGDLEEADQERLMVLQRRPVDEIARIDAAYAKRYNLALGVHLGERLKGLQRLRMAELREGNHARADACAIEDERRKLDELQRREDDSFGSMKDMLHSANKKERNKLIGGIDAVIETNRREALEDPASAGKSSSQAVRERLSAILETPDEGAGTATLGDALQKTLGEKVSGALVAETEAGKSTAEIAAQRLIEMEATGTTTHEKLSDLLRALREQARHDVGALALTAGVSLEVKQVLAAGPEQAVDQLAVRYTRHFQSAYDAARGDGRSYQAILDSASDYNRDMLAALTAKGGTLEPLDELEHAIGSKEADDIDAVLKRTPDVQKLVVDYDKKHGEGSLRRTLFGFGDPRLAEAALPIGPRGLLKGRQAALGEEALARPVTLGGEEEVQWLAAHGERERDVTESNKGAVGTFRSIGGDPETEQLMKHSAKRLVELEAEWTNFDPWGGGRPRQQILREMRQLRATLTGDAAAYEAENEKIIAEIKGAVTLAVQIAISLAVPGLAEGLLAQTLLNVGGTIASNMVIQGDQYSLDMLRADILGGGLGALGGKFGEEFVGGIADAVAGRTAAGATAAAEKAGVSTAIKAEQAAAMAAKGSMALRAAKFASSTTFSTVGTHAATGDALTLEDFEKAFALGLVTKGLETAGIGGPKKGPTETAAPGETPAEPTSHEEPVAGAGPSSEAASGGHEPPVGAGGAGHPDVQTSAEVDKAFADIEAGRPPEPVEFAASVGVGPGYGEGATPEWGVQNIEQQFARPNAGFRTRPGGMEVTEYHGDEGIAYHEGIEAIGQKGAQPGSPEWLKVHETNEFPSGPDPAKPLRNGQGVDVPGNAAELRVHSPNPEAPAGSASSTEWTAQLNKGKKYYVPSEEGKPGKFRKLTKTAPESEKAAAHMPLYGEGVPDPDSPAMRGALEESIETAIEAVEGLTEWGGFGPDPVIEVTSPPREEGAGGGPGASEAAPTVGEAIEPERLRDTYGMPEANQAKFQDICERHDVEIDVRPTTTEAPRLLEEGALPKMEDLKAKTIGEVDLLIGARPEDLGKVAYFKPRPPVRQPGMSPEAYGESVKRFSQRDAEYWDNARRMTELQRLPGNQRGRSGPMDERGTHQERQVKVGEGGVVSGTSGEAGSLPERPFTGDHDVFDIRKRDGSEFREGEYEQIVKEMKEAGMGVAHGAHMRWVPKSPAERWIFANIVGRHASGKEPLIRFRPGGPPTTALPR